MLRLPTWIATAEATLDERGLGAGRIALALVLLVDLARRLTAVSLWYSNDGLLPNHTVLWAPTLDPVFSPFFNASHTHEAVLLMVACSVPYLALLVGYRTRLAQLLSFVAVLSLHGRVVFLETGGDAVLGDLVLWTLFLPLGQRFSLDALALRRSGAASPSIGSADVTDWACFALKLQLAVIYFFNAMQKNGPLWQSGLAVHYALQLDSTVTGLGVFLRNHMTRGLSAILTHGARLAEGVVPALLLLPSRRGGPLLIAVALVVPLHVGFALFMNLGLFSAVMVAYAVFLVPGLAWDFVERRVGASALARHVRSVAELVAARLPRPTSPRAVLAERPRKIAKHALLLVVAALAYTELGVENPGLPRSLRLPQPALARALVSYLQLFQGWTMFAPDPPRIDYAISVDALTADGRHIDPLNEAFRPGRAPPTTPIPAQLGYDDFANRYLNQIEATAAYHRALGEWILRYPERTGRREDRIVSFTVRALEDESPPPGLRASSNPRSRPFLRYPDDG